MPCFDIEGATVDCNDPATVASGSIGYSAPDFSVTANNPVAAQAGSTNGASGVSGIWTSILNFGTTAIKAVAPQPATSGLRLQVNPATGQTQYYNPATGQYLAGGVGTSGGGLFGGSNSFILIIVALVVAFFAFGGRKSFARA